MTTAPAMVAPQEAAWLGLLEVTEIVPANWCLIGGQMVHMYCWERGVTPDRPTNDGDAALDVRARPEILAEFTAALMRLGLPQPGRTRAGTSTVGCAVPLNSTC